MQVVAWRSNNKYGMFALETFPRVPLTERTKETCRIIDIPASSWQQFRFSQNTQEGQLYIKQIWSEGNAYRSEDDQGI